MGHPQFLVLGPKRRKQIFLIRMFFIFLGGPKAHEPSGRDDKARGVAQVGVVSECGKLQIPPSLRSVEEHPRWQ
jgi:hypothetical protein